MTISGKDLDFSNEALKAAEKGFKKLSEALVSVKKMEYPETSGVINAELEKELHWQAAERKIKDDITATGLRYQLVTQHTSLVAVEQESSVPFDETLKTRPVPINLPAGWDTARCDAV